MNIYSFFLSFFCFIFYQTIMNMSKIYQPIIIKRTNEIIEILTETHFFSDYDLDSTEFAKTYLLDKLTEKFISGEYDMDENEFFEEEEFEKVLREIVAGTILYDLKKKGFVESYDDDITEEKFFLTERGKDLLNNND